VRVAARLVEGVQDALDASTSDVQAYQFWNALEQVERALVGEALVLQGGERFEHWSTPPVCARGVRNGTMKVTDEGDESSVF
jgi:hypothetical protein